MGLALHDPASALPDLITENRHIPDTRGPVHTRRHRHHHQQISKAKYLRWADRYEWHAEDGLVIYSAFARLPRTLHPHQIAVLNACRRSDSACSVAEGVRLRKRSTPATRSWIDEADDGRDLARSRVPLPSDGDRGRRPPSLERQEAFVDDATKKSRRSSPDDTQAEATQEKRDIAELYRLGLLYDDEYHRGSGFSLDAIVHDEPAYTLNVQHKGRRGTKRKAEQDQGWCHELPLDLSFAALGDDDALAQWLLTSRNQGDDSVSQSRHPPLSSIATGRPLAIVYELDDTPESTQETTPDLLADDGGSDADDGDWAVLQVAEYDGLAEDTTATIRRETDAEADEAQTPDDWVMLV